MEHDDPVQNSSILDGWTHSEGYARALQSPKQIGEVLKLLDLASSDHFLDVGCGNGSFAIAAAIRHQDCRVVALDCLEDAVAECRRRAVEAGASNLVADVASADRLPLEDQSVDRALSRNVLHHLDDANASFREIARVLRPTGILVLETPYNSGPDSVGEALTEIFRVRDNSHVRHYHSEDAIRGDLEEHGLDVVACESWTMTNRTPPGPVLLLEATEAARWLRVQQADDGVLSYDLPVLRLVASRRS